MIYDALHVLSFHMQMRITFYPILLLRKNKSKKKTDEY